MEPDGVKIDKRNGGCGAIFENRLYVWGGNTTIKQRPFADLQLSSDSSDDEDEDDDDNRGGGARFDLNREIETAVIIPKPGDSRFPFDVLDLSTVCWSQQPTRGDVPLLGLGSSLTAHPPTRLLYLYGGWNDGEFDAEVYKIKVDMEKDVWEWEKLEPATAIKPSPRYLTGVLIHGNVLSMFGGVGKEIVKEQDPGAKYVTYIENGVPRTFGWNNEYYEFDLDTHEWTAPLGKHSHRPDPIGTFAYTKLDRQRAIMFGGTGSKGRVKEVYIFDLEKRKWTGPLLPSPEQLWPEPTRFSTFTPLVDPDLVGKRLANGYGPVLEQKLVLLWGKASAQLICPDTWLLELKETKEDDSIELKWSRIYMSQNVKPRSWHIAQPVYVANSTECDIVIFGGNVHIEGHYGDRDNTADLRILSSGVLTLRNQCLSVIVNCSALQAQADNLPTKYQTQVRVASSVYKYCPRVRISSL